VKIGAIDRASVAALGGADVGVGLYLIGAVVAGATWVHAFVGVLGLLLALPAFWAAVSGRLVHGSAAGVLVNCGVLAFMTLDVAFLPGQELQRAGWVVLLAAATFATIGWYFRVFTAERRPSVVGRHQ
jgi:hypothetical protein